MTGLIAVTHFLIGILFSLFLFLLWARILLKYHKISPLHPVAQAVFSFTDPIVKPLENLMRSKKTKPSRYDWACLAVIFVVEIIKFTVISFLMYKAMMPLMFLLLFVIADLIVQPCNLFFYIILVRFIMSWVNPKWDHPLAPVLKKVSEPLLKLGRQLIPNISGYDFSPIVILISLKVITLFMSASLPARLV